MKQPSPHEPPHLSDADLELLNAALDDELPADQQTQLQIRLSSDGQLAQAMAELRMVRGTLRDLPLLPPPRSFTLAHAPRRRAGWWSRFDQLILMRTLAPAALVLMLALIWPLFNPAPAAQLTAITSEEAPAAAMAAPETAAGDVNAAAGMARSVAPEATAETPMLMAAAAPAAVSEPADSAGSEADSAASMYSAGSEADSAASMYGAAGETAGVQQSGLQQSSSAFSPLLIAAAALVLAGIAAWLIAVLARRGQ